MGYLDNSGLSHVITKLKAIIASKQDALVSGTNIKTVNGTSLLGSGNISITGLVDGILAVSAGGTGVSAYQQANVTLASGVSSSNNPARPCRHHGTNCTVVMYSFYLKSALASGSTVKLGDIPDGYRPHGTVSTSVCVGTNGNYANVYAMATNSGVITLYNRSGLSIPTSAALTLTFSYVI